LLPASALATLLQLRPAARTLLAELLLLTGQSLLALSSLSGATLWYAPAALATLLDLLLLLARQALLALSGLALSSLAGAALRSGSALLTLLQWRAAGTLFAELLLLARQSLLLSRLALSGLSGSALRSGSPLLTLLELRRATRARSTELLLLSRLTLLTLTTWLTAWLTSCALVAGLVRRALGNGRAALLRLLSLAALLTAGLTFVLLLALILWVLLGNDEAAVGCTRAIKRDAQLRDRNRRHQGAGEQDIAKLLQLPDGFEWQVPLLKCDDKAHRQCAACRPDCGTSSAPLRPDFGSRLNGFE